MFIIKTYFTTIYMFQVLGLGLRQNFNWSNISDQTFDWLDIPDMGDLGTNVDQDRMFQNGLAEKKF